MNNAELSVKVYQNQRVVTFKDIDSVHERPDGTARKRFNDNKKHFIEGEDFCKISPSEFRTTFQLDIDARQQNALIRAATLTRASNPKTYQKAGYRHIVPYLA